MAAAAISFAFLVLFLFVSSQAQSTVEFVFNGFEGRDKTDLSLDGATAAIINGGLLRLTDKSPNVIGHAFYHTPIQMVGKNSSSFNTSFVFGIVPSSSSGGRGGYGLAFTLSSTNQFPGAEAGHSLGLFKSSNQLGSSSNYIFAVEFDTVNGHEENADTEGNHVGINNNSLSSLTTEPAAYFNGSNTNKEDMTLESGERIFAWIEYDDVKKLVNVTISPSYNKPIKPLISRELDLTPFVEDRMYVGFSASTGTKSSSHYILGWSFKMNGAAPQLNISQLSRVPPRENQKSSSFNPQLVALIASLSAITLILLGILIFMTLYKKVILQHESLEEWELDCPHRFRYKDLYAATKGFKETEIIGVGGFGAVYKGVFPATGREVAVKKIVRNSIQGLREFAAEIESLGRLKHKNLVNLQGWCKQKHDLLIVYDYIPNGSLDSLLYKPKNNFVLTWDQRFNILKGIAAGLLFLHEDWDQVVIHRDVKSSNVLIDADMNARLGDFGLARLYDHDILSHTTNVVGTVGYIAPELARAGKVSTSSDVFAYGVLLFEMATGRRPIESGNFVLVDWVMEFHQLGKLVEVIDPKMNLLDVEEEVKLVLELGILCSQHKPEARPTMRQVTRFLNGDDSLPAIDWSSIDTRSESEKKSRLLLEAISADMTSTSCRSSSIGFISCGSINAGGR